MYTVRTWTTLSLVFDALHHTLHLQWAVRHSCNVHSIINFLCVCMWEGGGRQTKRIKSDRSYMYTQRITCIYLPSVKLQIVEILCWCYVATILVHKAVKKPFSQIYNVSCWSLHIVGLVEHAQKDGGRITRWGKEIVWFCWGPRRTGGKFNILSPRDSDSSR